MIAIAASDTTSRITFVKELLTKYRTKAQSHVGNVVKGRITGRLGADPFDSLMKQAIKNGHGSNRTPKVIAFARFDRGRKKGMKGRRALILGQIEGGSITFQLDTFRRRR